jgi:hypothetical protein
VEAFRRPNGARGEGVSAAGLTDSIAGGEQAGEARQGRAGNHALFVTMDARLFSNHACAARVQLPEHET